MTWLRVYQAGYAQVSEEQYLVTLVLGTNAIPADPAPDTFPAGAILYNPKNGGGGGIHPAIRWEGSGDDPPTGSPTIPLQGSLEYVTDALLPGSPYKGFRCLGDGTLTITFNGDDVAGVVGTVTCTPSILVNGSIVASSPHTTTDAAAPGFPYGHSSSWSVVTTMSVSAGDVISAQMSSTWGDTMLVPAGTGGNNNKLLISGDLT